MDAIFIVIKRQDIPLLSKNTTTEEGVLKIGPDMCVITEKIKVLKKKHLEVFDIVGKLKTKQISSDIDSCKTTHSPTIS